MSSATLNPMDESDVFAFDDPTVSPTSAMFPPSLFASGSDFLDVPSDHHLSTFGADGFTMGEPSSSRLPSLSPSSYSAPSLQLGPGSSSHSPHSSASPRSTYSTAVTDDFLFSNSFSSSELDSFLFPGGEFQLSKPSNGLFLPSQVPAPSDPLNVSFTQDDTVDMLNMFNASPLVAQAGPVTSGTTNMASIQPPSYNQPLQTLASQWFVQPGVPVAEPQWTEQKPSLLQLQSAAPPQPTPSFPVRRPAPNKPIAQARPAVGRQASAEKSSDSAGSPDANSGGKHNKTERRYRQKVQAAQAELRDSVPALRVMYGTSTEEQKATTDFHAADGTVDGLGEISRPNASAKATIFVGAKLYIELLQRRTASLQRKVAELEQWRSAVGGGDDLAQWQADFDAREAQIQAQLEALIKSQEIDDEDEDDDEDDAEVTKKRRRPAPKGRSKKVKGEDLGGVRVFAAFAMSFSLVPSASTLLKHAPASTDMTPGHVLSGKLTPTEIIAHIPLIAAEHVSRLLGKGLPSVLVPHPHTLVDWSWRLLVTLVLVVLLGPFVRRWSRRDEDTGAGDIVEVAKDTVKLASRRWVRPHDVDESSWLYLAASVIGQATTVTPLTRWHIAVHLHRTSRDAYSLALLALLRVHVPLHPSPESLWSEARGKLDANAPAALATVLALPFDEAVRSLELLPTTAGPISAIAEQVALVHLNDLYIRLFIHLVDTTAPPNVSPSIKALHSNVEGGNLGATLTASAFDKEIRSVVEGVTKGSAAHALGLVLIGLWGVFTGPAPAAQAALASALAGEEVKGAGSALASVSAMLELLYPGSSLGTSVADPSLPRNALAIDKLALVCIDYIRLLSSALALNQQSSRLQRLEASQTVQKATSHLRLILNQADFTGIEGEDEDEDFEDEARSFEDAKERLVEVLSAIGRRAAGRASGRDEDSGLEGDVDEL